MIRARRWQDMPRRPRHVASEAVSWLVVSAGIVTATLLAVLGVHVVALIVGGTW